MKRKAEDQLEKPTKSSKVNGSKKTVVEQETVHERFATGLFEKSTLQSYRDSYASSEPYKHGVIPELIESSLLRSVRQEIQEHLSFTPKETDIYRIHQSGDLANLDGLDTSSLKRLPSLLTLRDALYSKDFREYLSEITGAGSLSGKKTDMAINVYTPGCHLLCHDDVIGSRRVSYILYLTDPEHPWQPEWGGALRLFAIDSTEKDGLVTKTPLPDYEKSIPPAFNQLSFFAVQPGESFHDVEEVYSAPSEEQLAKDGRRIRMAISGWYHIPQEGEPGYEEGLEGKLAERSSLAQLQGKSTAHDTPVPDVQYYDAAAGDAPNSPTSHSEAQDQSPDTEADVLTEADCDFLLQYLAPRYLTPDAIDELSAEFADQSFLRLDAILAPRLAEALKQHISSVEADLGSSDESPQQGSSWKIAKPPHKHRFLYQQPHPFATPALNQATYGAPTVDPLQRLLGECMPSKSFRKWLHLATGLRIISSNVLARRFRRGKDYTLATNYEEDSARLEVTLGITPTEGWEDEDDGEEEIATDSTKGTNGSKSKEVEKEEKPPQPQEGVGGYEVYMAGDEEDDNDEAAAGSSDEGIPVPTNLGSTGARASGSSKIKSKPKPKGADPAIYKSAGDEDPDGGILFSMAPGWNRMSIVLRDKGVLRFVKYVSKSAPGDRWDLIGEYGVEDLDDEDEDDGDEQAEAVNGVDVDPEEEETEEEAAELSSDDSSV
ncbi:hypothetical protein MMC25_005036 [Agyrium rufum]|nr:hypothetical protein [Agyrium rufum]